MGNIVGERVVLGIETSCDETAVSIVNEQGSILSDEVLSQTEHSNYGGVVPELAARKHLDSIHALVERAMNVSGKKLDEIDAVAVTAGPGLIGSLIVGVM
ncbi:tRNA (adenosine(37)-N6)-threonylcarbamoyltransferase complex transferase subunit TsaD, partial [Anaplasma bovis]